MSARCLDWGRVRFLCLRARAGRGSSLQTGQLVYCYICSKRSPGSGDDSRVGQTRASYGSPTSSLVVGSIGLLRWAITAEVLAAVELGLGEPETVQVGDLLLDLRTRRVMRGDEEVVFDAPGV